MNPFAQVSRPMQVALLATLVIVAMWFGFIKKSTTGNDTAATPVTPTVTRATAARTPGKTNSALDKTAYAQVQVAKDAAAKSSSDAAKTSGQTGEGGTADAAARTAAATATKSSATKSIATTTPAAAATPAKPATAAAATATATRTAAPAATTPGVSRAQLHANHVILKIKKDLAAQKAVVVLVWSSKGPEDKILHKRIAKQIDLRRGQVKTFFIPVTQVGRYDGLLSGLSLGQTPSTIVIAPDNQAQVLGGLTSTARIDRLTSAAVLTKPVASTTPGTTKK